MLAVDNSLFYLLILAVLPSLPVCVLLHKLGKGTNDSVQSNRC